MGNLSLATRALALVSLVCLAQNGCVVSAQCADHSDCQSDEYCDSAGTCYPCTTCVVYLDSITGACPVCPSTDGDGVMCSSHDDCFAGRQYCDATGGCFACQGCLILSDGIDDSCPEWCLPEATSTTTTASPARVILGSTTTPSNSGGGGGSNGGEIAAGVVGCIVVVVAVAGAIWYLKRTKRKEEQNFVDMTNALALQEQARGSILALSLRHQHKRDSQASGVSKTGVIDEHGEYIDVAGLHNSHAARPPSNMDQQLYDDEFLDLAREIGATSDV